MDNQKFIDELNVLVQKFGCELKSSPMITLEQPYNQHYIPADPDVGREVSLDAVRNVQPLKIHIELDLIQPEKWHHTSGDDRRLHPDLNKPQREE